MFRIGKVHAAILARIGNACKVRPSSLPRLAGLAGCLAAAGAPAAAAEVRVYAAASLTAAVTALAEAHAEAGGGAVVLVTGASGALANQIVQGAPADVYLSANRDWVAFLVDSGAIDARSVVAFAGNRLVLIAPPGSALEAGDGSAAALADALDGLAVAIGDPAVAPVGAYARQALTALGLWALLEPSLVVAPDTSAVLAYVQRDAVDAGIVYATDAALTDARIVTALPEDSHDPIRYYAAPVAGGDADAAASFMALLQGARGAAVLAGLGFTAPDAAPAGR